MAGQTPAVSPALHPHLLVVAQSGRTMVPGSDRQGHPPGRVPQRERPRYRDRGLPESQQRQPETIRMDRHRGANPHQGRPRTSRPPASEKSITRHYTSTLLCAQPPAPADRHSNSRDTSSSTRQPQWPRRTPRCSLQIPGSSKRTRGTIAQTRCCHDQGEESRAATISLVKLPPPWPASSSTTRLLSGQARCRCHAVSSGPDTS